MKNRIIAISCVLIMLTILGITVYFFSGVRTAYLNGNGQKRATLLAEAIKKHYDARGEMPESLLRDLSDSGFFSDARGVKFQTSFRSDGFVIAYSPEDMHGSHFGGAASPKLIIKWRDGMEELDVESSIKLP